MLLRPTELSVRRESLLCHQIRNDILVSNPGETISEVNQWLLIATACKGDTPSKGTCGYTTWQKGDHQGGNCEFISTGINRSYLKLNHAIRKDLPLYYSTCWSNHCRGCRYCKYLKWPAAFDFFTLWNALSVHFIKVQYLAHKLTHTSPEDAMCVTLCLERNYELRQWAWEVEFQSKRVTSYNQFRSKRANTKIVRSCKPNANRPVIVKVAGFIRSCIVYWHSVGIS